MFIDAPAPSAPLSVAELNRRVRECLESRFPLSWISGEISNLTYAASGHVYFSLKDSQAQVRCVMWRSRAQLLGWRLENGQKIEARALVSFYEPRGEFQLNVEAVRRAGQGDLFERFLRLKAQLENEGLFAVDRKRPLPAFPRRLGIITSPQAAALRDVLSTLKRRAPHLALRLFPTPVQGEGAGQRIADAIQAAGHSDCDVLILCRGGGSIEDLWAFNEEVVARAIRACPIPLVSGVGHETDFTIADFAADLRAPTPTAAAELAAPDRDLLRQQLAQMGERLARHQERGLAQRQQALDWLGARLLHPAERLRQQGLQVQACGQRLALVQNRNLERQQSNLAGLEQRLRAQRPQAHRQQERLLYLHQGLQNQLRQELFAHRATLTGLERSLQQLNPHAVLARGYALALDASGHAVRDANALRTGDRLTLSFARGHAAATVTQVVAPPEAD